MDQSIKFVQKEMKKKSLYCVTKPLNYVEDEQKVLILFCVKLRTVTGRWR